MHIINFLLDMKQIIAIIAQSIKIDYFIESAPYGLLFTSRKTLETNEWVSKVL